MKNRFSLLSAFASLCILGHSILTANEFPWVVGAPHGSELEFVSPFLPANPSILEAGAHHGWDTIELSKKWPEGKIFSFEPCESSFQQLVANTASCPNVRIFPFGLFSTTGYFTFNFSPTNDGSSSLLPDNHLNGMSLYNDESQTVYCMNLDEWAISEGIESIDYMWLDMEGSELYVLEAAPKILSTVKAISAEANFQEFRKGMTQFVDLKVLLENRGFTLYKIWGDPTWQGTAVFIRSELLQ